MGTGLSCEKLRRRESAEGRVRTDRVVVRLLVVDQVLRVPHAYEAVLVQEPVSHARVEALSKRLLHGLASVVFDAMLVAPLVECLVGEFGALVRTEPARLAVQFHCTIEDAQHAPR